MSVLYSIHDIEGHHLVPPGGWCLDTIALTENPQPKDYKAIRSDINWIVRVNHGYGSTGTLPGMNGTAIFIQQMVDYVLGCRGLTAYIMSNEPNHSQERPGGNILSPKYVATTFSQVRHAIRPFNREVLGITTPVAPYHASPMDWLYYLKEMLTLIANQGGADAIGIHAYVRGGKPQDVFSSEKMGPPLTGQYNGFRTYRDALGVVPSSLKRLPAFITECNPLLDNGWPDANSGLVRAIYDEIDTWNGAVGTQKVHCVTLYRYPNYNDKFYIEGKNGVIQDFQEAVAKGYSVDMLLKTVLPSVKKENEEPSPPQKTPVLEAKIDPRAVERGVRVEEIELKAGEWGSKVEEIRWYNEQEADLVGPDHHILVDVVDSNGQRMTDVAIKVVWPSGFHRILTESKPGELAAANFPMSPSRNEFSVLVDNPPFPSDKVTGIGMGMETPDGFNAGIHTSTYIRFKLVKGVDTAAEPPVTTVVTPKPPVPTPVNTVPPLLHPVADPEFRRITQIFGVNGDAYKRFSVSGVPLKGHNGVDFGTPIGSKIQAVYSGKVVEARNDPDGYGLYVKLVHFWGESLYAHLSQFGVQEGDQIEMGRTVGFSGNTGNSTGPHLHFGMRVNPYRRNDGWGGYTDPLPYLQPQLIPQPTEPTIKPAIVSVLRQVAGESGLDFELLASLAWAESSFNPTLDDGLFQIGDMTWSDHAGLVHATNINNPLDNARVGASYLKRLLQQTNNDLWKALYAWNWGIGNVLKGKEPPQMTKTFANKVIHGRDLLKATGA